MGFAAATTLIVGGVVVAPAINSCIDRDGPFLGCVVGQITGSAATDQTANVATETGEEAGSDDERLAPAPVTEDGDETQTATAQTVPDFTIARAAPDGMVVIVGTADPEHEVSVLIDGEIAGVTKPERTGEWVFVPEQALDTGGVEITVQAATPAGGVIKSAKSEIVLIDPSRDKEPIVIASVPGQASEIIQGLDALPEEAVEQPIETAEVQADTDDVTADMATETEVQADAQNPSEIEVADIGETAEVPEQVAEQEVDPEAAATASDADQAAGETMTEEAQPAADVASAEQQVEADVNADATADDKASTAIESEVEVADSTNEEPVPTDSNDSENTDVPTEIQVAEISEPVNEAVNESAAESDKPDASAASAEDASPVAVDDSAGETVADQAAPDAQAVDEEMDVASLEGDAVEPEPEAIAEPDAAATAEVLRAIEAFVQPTIDAIEIDGQQNFIAGGGPEGGVVRLYVENEYVADAEVKDGRWLVETDDVLTEPSQRVRADLIDPNTASVIARAEVNFVVERIATAETEPEVETAEAPDASEATPEETVETTDDATAEPTLEVAETETEEAVATDEATAVADAAETEERLNRQLKCQQTKRRKNPRPQPPSLPKWSKKRLKPPKT